MLVPRRVVFSVSALTGVAGIIAASPAPAATTTCPTGYESIAGKCVAPCPAGTKRAIDGLACVTEKAPLVCKVGYEPISGKCVPLCPAGTKRAIDGLACVAK